MEEAQQQGAATLGAEGLGLLGWAWQRREALGYSNEDLLSGLPAAWRNAARQVLVTWEDVARASSAVENWHSILRPHLAVHRVLSIGMLALVAVWHSHRRFARGKHAGQSPLELSGIAQQPGDWLEVLVYPAALITASSSGWSAAA